MRELELVLAYIGRVEGSAICRCLVRRSSLYEELTWRRHWVLRRICPDSRNALKGIQIPVLGLKPLNKMSVSELAELSSLSKSYIPHVKHTVRVPTAGENSFGF